MFLKISCFISCFHVFIFCQACSARPVKSIMLGFFGSSLKFSPFPRKAASLVDFVQSFCMKKSQSICSWIRFLISLVQFLLLILVELFRFYFSALCLLNSWLYAAFLSCVTALWSSLLNVVCSIFIRSCNSMFTGMTLHPFCSWVCPLADYL